MKLFLVVLAVFVAAISGSWAQESQDIPVYDETGNQISASAPAPERSAKKPVITSWEIRAPYEEMLGAALDNNFRVAGAEVVDRRHQNAGRELDFQSTNADRMAPARIVHPAWWGAEYSVSAKVTDQGGDPLNVGNWNADMQMFRVYGKLSLTVEEVATTRSFSLNVSSEASEKNIRVRIPMPGFLGGGSTYLESNDRPLEAAFEKLYDRLAEKALADAGLRKFLGLK